MTWIGILTANMVFISVIVMVLITCVANAKVVSEMAKVSMTRSDWDTVVMILEDARDSGRFAYFDHIIDSVNDALDTQEN